MVGSRMGNVVSNLEHTHLDRAPLARVLAQVRFPSLSSMNPDMRSLVASLRPLLSDYPVVRELPNEQLIVGDQKIDMQPHRWLLQTIEADWSITVSELFVAVETTDYSGGQDEFIRRFTELTNAAASVLKPAAYDRLGVRYTNSISDASDFESLEQLVKLPLLGGQQLGGDVVAFERCISEAVYKHPDDTEVVARWGVLGANIGFDPSIPPPTTRHWFLDIDVFAEKAARFDPDELTDRCRDFANLEYDFFRTCVTDEFLDHFGQANAT